MFGFFKKKAEIPVEVQQVDVEKEMGLTEYVSVASIKAHLVDVLEESRQLKEECKKLREDSTEEVRQQRKKYELQSVMADEWKERARKAEQEAERLRVTVDEQNDEIEKLQKKCTGLIADAETARDLVRKTEEEAQRQRSCRYWLEERLKSYGSWEKVTKTQLVEILKEAMKREQDKTEG